MKVFLIRHGETTGDLEDRYGGEYNDHLTAKGEEQSKKLAQELKNKNIEIIFASPYFRAQETANFVQKVLDCPVETVNDLRERSYGLISGMTKKEVEEKYPETAKLQKVYSNNLPGGEAYGDFKNRIAYILNGLAKKPYSTIAVITHGGPIRCIFREILKQGELTNLGDCEFFEINI